MRNPVVRFYAQMPRPMAIVKQLINIAAAFDDKGGRYFRVQTPKMIEYGLRRRAARRRRL